MIKTVSSISYFCLINIYSLEADEDGAPKKEQFVKLEDQYKINV